MSQHMKFLGGLNKLGPEETKNLLKTVPDRCFNGEPISEDQLFELLNFMNDVYFVLPMKLFVENQIRRTFAPIYCCKFSYVGNEKTYTDPLIKRRIIGDFIFLNMQQLRYTRD
ncbi:uncharacterized protein LOC143148564 [Ptiloglossa arizonensis]|uniref:uncharacterized protein LOC143148564 n=1 Tax=Ptiloglossa arizonensis TaxID=3350558 RepID=UPI003F9FD1BD